MAAGKTMGRLARIWSQEFHRDFLKTRLWVQSWISVQSAWSASAPTA